MLDTQIDNEEPLGCEGILPSQFYGRTRDLSPEQRLLLAVLEDALECWQRYCRYRNWSDLSYDNNRLSMQVEADHWIFGYRPSGLPFTMVCESLDIRPDYIRRKLTEWAASRGYKWLREVPKLPETKTPAQQARELLDRRIVDLTKQGLKVDDIAHAVGLGRRTLFRRRKQMRPVDLQESTAYAR